MLFETCDQFSRVMLRYFVVVCSRQKEKEEEESIRAFTGSTLHMKKAFVVTAGCRVFHKFLKRVVADSVNDTLFLAVHHLVT